MGGSSVTYYEVKKDCVIEGDTLSTVWNLDNVEYYLNDKKISKAEFSKLCDRDKGIQYITKSYYDAYAITDENIAREFQKIAAADYEKVDEIECLKLYSDYLTSEMDQEYLSFATYVLTDLDENGMPELFIKIGAADACFCMIQNGKVVDLAKNLPLYRWILINPDTNEICFNGEGYENSIYQYGYIENNAFVPTDTYESISTQDRTVKIYHNGEQVDIDYVSINKSGFNNMENLIEVGANSTYEEAVYYYFENTLDGFSEEYVNTLLNG